MFNETVILIAIILSHCVLIAVLRDDVVRIWVRCHADGALLELLRDWYLISTIK